jgi:hypothetical protein
MNASLASIWMASAIIERLLNANFIVVVVIVVVVVILLFIRLHSKDSNA